MIAQSTPVTPAWREDLAAAEAGIPGACHEAVNKILKNKRVFLISQHELEIEHDGVALAPAAGFQRHFR
jgi:hypothetical protein